jgi:hypothetical protein
LLNDLWCSAATSTWNGSVSSDWFTANNWIPAGVPASTATIYFTNGTISLTNPVTIGGAFNWSGGTLSGDAMNIGSGGLMNIAGNVALQNLLTNDGTVTMTGSVFMAVFNNHTANYNGGVYNLPGALWDIQTNAVIFDEELGDEFFHNAGTVRKSQGADTAEITVPFTNSATVTNLIGALNFSGGGVLAGRYGVAAGATIDFATGSFSMGVPPVISGAGLCEFTGTTLTLASNVPPDLVLASGNLVLGSGFQNHGGITNLTLSGSSLTGANIVTGTLVWDGGTLAGPMTIGSGGLMNIAGNVALQNLLTNDGTVTMTGSVFMAVFNNHTANYNGGVYNLARALWDIQTNAVILDEQLGDEFFNNAGTVRKSLGADTAEITVPFTNSATVSNLMGTLNFGGGGVLAGGYDIAAGATINFASGSFSMGVPPVISGAGLCEFTGTTLRLTSSVPPSLVLAGGDLIFGSEFQNHGGITNLTLSGSTLPGTNIVTGTLVWDGGTFAGPITIGSGGLMNIAGNVSLQNVLTNDGTVTMTGAAFMGVYNNHTANYNGGVYNLPGALWDIQTNAVILDEELGDEFFNNAGTVRKSQDVGTAEITVPFTNTGTVGALVGTLSFDNTFVTAGGTLAFGVSSASSFGQIDVSGAIAINGTASVAWLDGFIPAVSNSFSLLDYGSHSGTFANITLPPEALGQGNYGATVFSLLITGRNTQNTQPLLSIERVNEDTVDVLWPASATNFVLQIVTNLSSANWSNVTGGITAVGTNYVLTSTINGKAAFFRLQAP